MSQLCLIFCVIFQRLYIVVVDDFVVVDVVVDDDVDVVGIFWL